MAKASTATVIGTRLPAGIVAEGELQPNGPWIEGRVLDQQAHPDFPVQRWIRVLTDSEAARDELLAQAKRLLQAGDLPHVLPLHSAGALADGRLYLLTGVMPSTLAARIPPDRGLEKEVAMRFIEPLLEGLASLHSHGIAHGDVCEYSVAVDGSAGEHSRLAGVWIANAAIGGLAWWSGGQLAPPHAREYLPPEWDGATQSPSAQADLYALGLLLCRVALGTEAVREIQREENAAMALRAQLLERIRERFGRHSPMYGLVGTLLSEPMHRPQNAVIALELFRRAVRKEQRRPWLWALVVLACIAVATVVFAGVVRSRAADRQRQLEQHLQEARSTISERDQQLRNAEAIIKNQEPEIQVLPDPIPEPPNPDPEGPSAIRRAQQWWQENASISRESPVLPSSEELAAISNAEIRSEVGKWHARLKKLQFQTGAWLDRPPALSGPAEKEYQEKFPKLMSSPWDKDLDSEVRKVAQSLLDAARAWEEWANRDSLAVAELDALIEGQSPAVQRILKGWRAAMVNRSRWTLRLRSGTAPEGWGVWRYVGVLGRDDWVYSGDHKWDSPTRHVYPQSGPVPEISFLWSMGNPTGVCLYGERRWGTFGLKRSLLISGESSGSSFEGPLAVWRMHHAGQAKEGKFKLEFDVVDCPGPPRNWRPRLPSAQ